MNIGLVTSFIIAGVLLLSILSMNKNMSNSSTELTMRQIVQIRANTIADILQKDLPNIGSNITKAIGDTAILVAHADRFSFEGNIDNAGAVETLEWHFTNIEATGTPNSSDFHLIRKVDSDTTIFKSGVTAFEFRYRDKDYNLIPTPISSASERQKIRHITITFTVGSDEMVGGPNGQFINTDWSKTFTPINLHL